MIISSPYNVGDQIEHNGETYEIKGIHIFVTKKGTIEKWRFHIGNGEFITIPNEGR